MKIMIAGDLVPTQSNIDLFEKNLISFLDKNFINKWFNSDYRIFNLECPITENKEPILKFGPNLSCAKKAINGIKELRPSLILLANNHILDYGAEGLDETLEILNKNKIIYTGILENSVTPNDGYIFQKDGIKVGIYNICDNEFSIASMSSKGTANLNILKNYQEIKNLKSKCDYLILVYHGGKEFYRYPTPNLKNLCEFYCEIGADIVICQHSHCIGSEESYKNSTIIYGQGDFLFDDGNNEFLNTSLILEIEFTKENYKINYIPIEKEENIFKLSNDKKILENFFRRSSNNINDEYLKKELDEFSDKKINNYMALFSKRNILNRIINKIYKKNYYLKKYSKNDLVKILNIIECEAHREVLINGLKKYLESDK